MSCTLELVSCRFRGNVRHWSLLAGRRFRLSVPWCFAVSQPPARTSLWSCFEGMGAALRSWFLVGSCPQARSVLQGHGVLLFRNRPLGLRCGAALKAWELQFGAGFSGIITLEINAATSANRCRSGIAHFFLGMQHGYTLKTHIFH